MRRYLFFASALLLLVLGLSARPAAAAEVQEREAPKHAVEARYVCVPNVVWQDRALCPPHGPGTTAYRLASIRLPEVLPELPAQELPVEEDEDFLPHTYAIATSLPLDVYRHPMEAAEGLPPVRTMLSGSWWVSIEGAVEYEGQTWYRINPDEYVPAEALSFASPSRFQGVYLHEQPQLPFAWINRWTEPSVVPQGPVNEAVAPLERYQRVTIFAEERRGSDQVWYLVDHDQWVEQSHVSRVDVSPPPAEVGPGEKWIEVDLFEQTIAAYEGGRMVYATLISSGRSATATPPGLYRVYYKLLKGKMSNPDVPDGSPIYYYIEDVPWSLYFHGGYSIHTAYWHNSFGFLRSYGCVNLAPRDARWFFEWSDPPLPEGRNAIHIPDGAPSTWVWVHYSSPFE
ncbi:MAG: L,D-transpeptidase [Chloroflexota bacterium]